ncbi:efflux RND transporter periplasmic adaptor subunit [Frigoriglobus tundricola]|uniref:CusB-like beta-barrel domain-containing protein n=1 Tax=Frigoriglobus tundricola TaxID=2774151 RepID=A0A6M5YNB7_9BACT|nr:efflux RND transporter periplasmic adaptor subunit [Frigoriglobus tundricola]QJW94793.1 hypothetical protein FTUN_2316 [Frigoriglobus tundricola]
MTKRKGLFGAVVAAVVVVGVAVGGLALGPPGGPPKGRPVGPPGPAGGGPNGVRGTDPVVVTLEATVARPVQRTVSVVGSLYGREEVSVSPKAEGRVRWVRHDVGDEVAPGAVLAELDPTDAEFAIAEAQKGLDLELAKLGMKEPPGGAFDITTLPAVARALARERLTEAKHRRQVNSRTSGVGSEEDFAQAEYDYRDAKEASRQAKFDAETTLAAVRQRLAVLDTARQRLKDTRICAPPLAPPTPVGPSDGTSPGRNSAGEPVNYLVAQRTVSEGEMVRSMAGGLFRLVAADALKLQAAVPERYLGEVKVGQRVEIRVEAFPRAVFPGAVARVNPTVDRANRTFQIEVAAPNPNRRLAPGCFAKAEIRTRLDPDAVLVPEEALVQYAGVTKVFTVRGDKAVAVAVRSLDGRVEIGAAGRSRFLVEVASELRAGDRVVTTGQTKLTDGAPVRLRGEPEKEVRP